MKMEEKLVHTMDEQCHVRENGQENDNAEEEEEEEEEEDDEDNDDDDDDDDDEDGFSPFVSPVRRKSQIENVMNLIGAALAQPVPASISDDEDDDELRNDGENESGSDQSMVSEPSIAETGRREEGSDGRDLKISGGDDSIAAALSPAAEDSDADGVVVSMTKVSQRNTNDRRWETMTPPFAVAEHASPGILETIVRLRRDANSADATLGGGITRGSEDIESTSVDFNVGIFRDPVAQMETPCFEAISSSSELKEASSKLQELATSVTARLRNLDEAHASIDVIARRRRGLALEQSISQSVHDVALAAAEADLMVALQQQRQLHWNASTLTNKFAIRFTKARAKLVSVQALYGIDNAGAESTLGISLGEHGQSVPTHMSSIIASLTSQREHRQQLQNVHGMLESIFRQLTNIEAALTSVSDSWTEFASSYRESLLMTASFGEGIRMMVEQHEKALRQQQRCRDLGDGNVETRYDDEPQPSHSHLDHDRLSDSCNEGRGKFHRLREEVIATFWSLLASECAKGEHCETANDDAETATTATPILQLLLDMRASNDGNSDSRIDDANDNLLLVSSNERPFFSVDDDAGGTTREVLDTASVVTTKTDLLAENVAAAIDTLLVSEAAYRGYLTWTSDYHAGGERIDNGSENDVRHSTSDRGDRACGASEVERYHKDATRVLTPLRDVALRIRTFLKMRKDDVQGGDVGAFSRGDGVGSSGSNRINDEDVEFAMKRIYSSITSSRDVIVDSASDVGRRLSLSVSSLSVNASAIAALERIVGEFESVHRELVHEARVAEKDCTLLRKECASILEAQEKVVAAKRDRCEALRNLVAEAQKEGMSPSAREDDDEQALVSMATQGSEYASAIVALLQDRCRHVLQEKEKLANGTTAATAGGRSSQTGFTERMRRSTPPLLGEGKGRESIAKSSPTNAQIARRYGRGAKSPGTPATARMNSDVRTPKSGPMTGTPDDRRNRSGQETARSRRHYSPSSSTSSHSGRATPTATKTTPQSSSSNTTTPSGRSRRPSSLLKNGIAGKVLRSDYFK